MPRGTPRASRAGGGAKLRGRASRHPRGPATLAIDIGGTGLKASVLDEAGTMLVDRVRVETPVGSPPEVIVEALAKLTEPLPPFDRVSVGFPGVVRDGRVLTAPNLKHDTWMGFDLATALRNRLGKPTRVVNDADMQGLAAIQGKGVELVITLGTGFGTALYLDGRLAPHLELAHHPFRKGETYEEQLGNGARKQAGTAKWNKRIQRAIDCLRALVHFDHLYIGGGNARKIAFQPGPDTTIISNEAGIRGGIALWRDG
jgi:polyphosphate glucokinase